MSRYYASIQGNRGEATRQGFTKSGIRGHIRGWMVGIKVQGFVNTEGEDEFIVFLTSGSGGHKPSRIIGSFTREDLE